VDLTTKGDFVEALKIFRQTLRSVCLLALTSQEELKQLQALIVKLVEYTTAMRIEIERKTLVQAKGDAVRIAELACLMSLCQMEHAHKFLAYKSAFTLLYKMGNYITAAHFAR
jgi:coatomer subunit alpha